MKTKSLMTAIVLLTVLGGVQVLAAPNWEENLIERGRYLVTTAGCNDCHTPGYPQADGKIPESQWLTGTVHGKQMQAMALAAVVTGKNCISNTAILRAVFAATDRW